MGFISGPLAFGALWYLPSLLPACPVGLRCGAFRAGWGTSQKALGFAAINTFIQPVILNYCWSAHNAVLFLQGAVKTTQGAQTSLFWSLKT